MKQAIDWEPESTADQAIDIRISTQSRSHGTLSSVKPGHLFLANRGE